MAPKHAFHSSMLITQPEMLLERRDTATLIACGAPRSMTSLIAFVLYEMGEFIGSELHRRNLEDQEMLRAILFNVPVENQAERVRDPETFEKLVKKRNAEHARWGFKIPDAIFQLPGILPQLRAPIIIATVRNPLSTAKSVITQNPAVKGGLQAAFAKAQRANAVTEGLIKEPPCPAIIINMDVAMAKPLVFLKEFSEAVGVSADVEGLAEKISKKGYQTPAVRPSVTFHQKAWPKE